jgi:hypothetical protein
MKQSMQTSFEYMSRPEHATNAVLFLMCFALFFILMGVGIAWVVSLIIDRKVNKPESFEDFYSQRGLPSMKKAK